VPELSCKGERDRSTDRFARDHDITHVADFHELAERIGEEGLVIFPATGTNCTTALFTYG
jgi:hypothetical protein